jgi:hypothetical protein
MPLDRVTAAMVYEQALQVCSALVACALLFPFWEWQRGLTALSLLIVPAIVVLLHPRVFSRVAAWLLRLLHRPPLEVTMSFRTVLALLAYYVAAWIPAGFGAWLLARAVVGLPADAVPLVREAVLAASLAGELTGGVALAWALLLRLWVTVMELAFVGLALLVDSVRRPRRGQM